MGTGLHPLGVSIRPQNLSRGKSKHKADYGAKALYEFYARITAKSLQVDSNKFYTVIRDFNDMVAERILQGGDFKVPFSNGYIRVFKYTYGKRKSLPIDYKRTYELGFRVAHLNDERDGAIYRWRWIKPTKVQRVKPYLQYYSFTPCRKIKRLLKKALTENPSLDFYEYRHFNIH